MVDFEEVGAMITLIMIIAGSMFSLLPAAFGGDTLGLPTALYSPTIAYTNEKITALIQKFNDDAAMFTSSTGVNQIGYLASMAITASGIVIGFIFAGLTNWVGVVDALFAFDLAGTAFIRIPLQIMIGIIVYWTLLKIAGNVIKSLPFFGG